VATFSRGEFFGEVALMKEDLRTANVYSVDLSTCYVLERKAFTNLIGSLTEAKKESAKDQNLTKKPKRTINPLVKRAKVLVKKLLKILCPKFLEKKIKNVIGHLVKRNHKIKILKNRKYNHILKFQSLKIQRKIWLKAKKYTVYFIQVIFWDFSGRPIIFWNFSGRVMIFRIFQDGR